MEKNTIIGIILIILSIHLIFNRKWIAEKQEAWAKKRGGIILKSYQSKSRKEQEAMIAISGPLSLVAGLGYIFSEKLINFKVASYVDLIPILFVFLALASLIHALLKNKSKLHLVFSVLFLFVTVLLLSRVW